VYVLLFNHLQGYGFPPGLALAPENVRLKGIASSDVLSETDKLEIKERYPPQVSSDEKWTPLYPFLSVILDVESGGQRDFSLSVDVSRKYTIMTIGRSVDTILVLFENDASTGQPIYIQGTNDSGMAEVASMEVRLVRGRSYVLRARLVYAPIRSEVAVIYY
jgi:hypothetical protein